MTSLPLKFSDTVWPEPFCQVGVSMLKWCPSKPRRSYKLTDHKNVIDLQCHRVCTKRWASCAEVAFWSAVRLASRSFSRDELHCVPQSMQGSSAALVLQDAKITASLMFAWKRSEVDKYLPYTTRISGFAGFVEFVIQFGKLTNYRMVELLIYNCCCCLLVCLLFLLLLLLLSLSWATLVPKLMQGRRTVKKSGSAQVKTSWGSRGRCKPPPPPPP